MLLETVQSQLGLIVNVNLHRVLHELRKQWLVEERKYRERGENYLLTDRPDVLAEGGGEHHHLLLVGSGPEDLLDVPPHVQLVVADAEEDLLVLEVEGQGLLARVPIGWKFTSFL